MTRRIRITLLAGAGFFLVQLGWILSISPNYGIDEFDHVLRASSVAAGHWEPGNNPPPAELGRGDLIPVRADVAASVRTACEARPYTKLYNCRPAQDLGNGEVLIASGASRYNPVFYAVVGTAAAPFHGTANLYALRIATALLAVALFMLAIWLAAGQARTLWPVAVTVLAALPTTVYSASISTPNGVEMISGLGVWVALLAVAGPDRGQRRSAYLLLALFTAALISLHTLGVVWLFLILVAVGIIHGPVSTLKALWPRDRVEVLAGAISGSAIVFEAAWIVLARANDPGREGLDIPGSPWGSVLNGLLLWPLQAIGAFPMRDNAAPMTVYAIMVVVLGAVAVLTLRRTPWRSRSMLALGFVAVASFVVPAGMMVMTYHQLGSAWQGRYGMPFTVGLLVLAGRQLDSAEHAVPRARALAALGAAALVLAHFLSQWAVMTKQRADFDLVAGTHWVPPSAALLVALAVAAALCWVRTFKADSRDRTHAVAPATVPELQEVSQ